MPYRRYAKHAANNARVFMVAPNANRAARISNRSASTRRQMLISTRLVTAMQQRTAAMKRHWVYPLMVLALLIAGSLALPSADAQQSETRAQTTNAQDDLRQNFLIQHQIGQR